MLTAFEIPNVLANSMNCSAVCRFFIVKCNYDWFIQIGSYAFELASMDRFNLSFGSTFGSLDMIHTLYFMSFFVLYNGNHVALIRQIAGFAYKQAFDS